MLKKADAQFLYNTGNIEFKGKIELTNFQIKDYYLFFPSGDDGLRILDITDNSSLVEIDSYNQTETRENKEIEGTANKILISDDKAYLAYGNLGMYILDISDVNNIKKLGSYYRFHPVFSIKLYDKYAFLGTRDIALDIVDLSNLNDIELVGRYNIKDYKLYKTLIKEPFVILVGGENGLRTYQFADPFNEFKTNGFPKDYNLIDEVLDLEIRGEYGFMANGIEGFQVLNLKLPLYPLKIAEIKTTGFVNDILIHDDILFVATNQAILTYNISNPEEPSLIYEYKDKKKDFRFMLFHDYNLYVSYYQGRRNYGIAVFQYE